MIYFTQCVTKSFVSNKHPFPAKRGVIAEKMITTTLLHTLALIKMLIYSLTKVNTPQQIAKF